MTKTDTVEAVRYRVTGMDCSACAAKIENAARSIAGVQDAKVSIASREMTLRTQRGTAPLAELERSITGLDYRLARIDEGDDDEKVPDLSYVTPAYRRALWIVVLLNAGYGIIEIVGGFIAGSQSVKADALDFIGDGVISFLGLIAVGWGLAARAKAAFAQGIFLGVLGTGVLVVTAYRVLAQHQPEARLMGILALIGLVVNVIAALVLLPHRQGDANVRAVWLFSRNDAIGNVAVVTAAPGRKRRGLTWSWRSSLPLCFCSRPSP
jgi:cation transport ATPase